ncbi:MAG: SH3-like domain-containing protein, partial [Pseudomonadota bacterium]|nr:SH3-like domain-containing protein [Pseudomonadota bacterium]
GEHLYSIRFASREIWGEDTNPGEAFSVRVDLWEPHLEVL